MRTLLLTAVLFLFTNNVLSAQIILGGTVTEAASGEPLEGVLIAIPELQLYRITDQNGEYRFDLATPKEDLGIYLNVQLLGYIKITEPLILEPIEDRGAIARDFEMVVDPLTLKHVVVSANKVEEELQDVPIAITVLDAVDLRKRTVSNTDEAFHSVPNLVTDAFLPSQSTFSLRGLASDFISSVGIENSVGFYIDDVFYSRSFHFNQTLMDIKRVEVLRGPQGTLFGKNSVGGVLHIISEEPKMSNFGSVEVSAGNYNLLQVRGKGNVMLAKDKLALRMTGAYRQRNGWLLDNNPDITDENATLFYGGRAALLFKPNEKVSISLKGTLSRDDKAEFTVDAKMHPDSINPLRIPWEELNHLDRKVTTSASDAQFDRTSYAAIGKVEAKVDDVHTFTSISAINGSNGIFTRDVDASSVDGIVATYRLNLQAFSQELRLSTPRKDRKLFYVLGLYYLDEVIDNHTTLRFGSAFLPIFANNQGRPEWLNITDYSEASDVFALIHSRSMAAFASASYEISKRIRLSGGARYTNEHKELEYYQITDPYFPVSLVGVNQGSESDPIQKKVTDSVISWQFGMDFKTTDKVLLYINLSRGFKGSGFNTVLSRETEEEKIAEVFAPEFVNSYEFGLKIRSSNRTRMNIAAFVTDFKNKQEVNAFGGNVNIVTAEAVQGQGLEAELVHIFDKSFKLEAALGGLNIKYFDFPYFIPALQETINLAGNTTYKSPGFTFRVAPEYHTTLGSDVNLLIRADYNYTGKAYNDILNTEALARNAAGILNGRVEFTMTNNRYGLALWGKNLTDVQVVQHAWGGNFGHQAALNPPLTLGVELRVNFF